VNTRGKPERISQPQITLNNAKQEGRVRTNTRIKIHLKNKASNAYTIIT
jgi:hypothetical protein